MLGSLFIELVGATLRWIACGMKKPLKEIWLGVKEDDIYKSFAESVINKLIGFVFIICLLLLLCFIYDKYWN